MTQNTKSLNIHWLYQCIFLLALMVIFGIWSIHLGQDIGWDLLNYHYYNAYAFIHHRLGFDIAPAQIQTYINPFFDIFNYFLIATQKPRMVAFWEGAISGITAFFLFKSALLLFSETSQRMRIFYAALATVIGMTGMAGIWQLGVTSNDSKLALFITAALYCALLGITEKGNISSRWYIFICGLLLGLITGFKLTAACYAGGIFIALVCYRLPNQKWFRHLFLCAIGALLGFIIADGYWALTMYQHYASPFLPYYNNFFQSPYADLGRYADERYHPHTLFQYIFLPFYLINQNKTLPELAVQDPRLTVTFVLAIVFFVVSIGKRCLILFNLYPANFHIQKNNESNFKWRFLLIAFFVSYLAWLMQFTIYRYAIPLEIYSGLAIVFFAYATVTKKFVQIPLLITITLLIIFNTSVLDTSGRMPFTKHYFEMTIPPLPKAPLIITTTGAPVAYVIPFFPADARFVGGNNNFVSPGKTHRTQKIVEDLIKSYQGPLFSLTNDNEIDKKQMMGVLHYYRLKTTWEACKTFKTNIVGDQFYLCPLTRINHG